MGATARVWSLEPRPPRQPAGTSEWAPLVDTTYDGRLSDQQLLYLEALLRDEGIATVFVPWRPQEHYGIVGPQYPLALFVDARRREDAVAVWEDLLGDGDSFTYQLRLADPLVNIPSYRLELISAQATFRQLADFDVMTKVLALVVVAIGMLPGLGSGGVGLLALLLAPRLVVRYRRAVAEARSLEPLDAPRSADQEPRAEEDEERSEHAHDDAVDPG